SPGVLEPLVGDVAELPGAPCAGEGVVLVEQLEVAPVPLLGLAEVAQGGDVFVGVPKVERGAGFGAPVAGPLEQVGGFLVGLHAAGIALFPQDVAEVVQGRREVVDLEALQGVEFAGRGGQGGGGLLAPPGDDGVLELPGGGPVARLAGYADPVAGEDGPV